MPKFFCTSCAAESLIEILEDDEQPRFCPACGEESLEVAKDTLEEDESEDSSNDISEEFDEDFFDGIEDE